MTAYEMSISDWSSDVCSSDLIADALIVVGIEDQHRTIVIDRGLLLAQAPQRDRKPCSRPHIGPGLEKPPEVTGQLLELVAERPFACLHTLTVQRQPVLLGARFFLRELNIGRRASRGDVEAGSSAGQSPAPRST